MKSISSDGCGPVDYSGIDLAKSMRNGHGSIYHATGSDSVGGVMPITGIGVPGTLTCYFYGAPPRHG